jgi:ADP-heptose:LPS heptosyltransferase
VPGVRLFALQMGGGRRQLADAGFPIQDLAEGIDREGAFLDTAAILANLDLVISSDTALAHLAGALGRTTWVALSRGAEWRWQRTRTTTPWYRRMRLFRQSQARQWGDVFQALARGLQEEAQRQATRGASGAADEGRGIIA